GDAIGVAFLARREQQLDRGREFLVRQRSAGGVAVAESEGRVALFLVPDLLRQRERLGGERIVIALERASRARERRCRAIVERRGAAGEHPAVVGGAAAPVLDLAE